MRLATLLLMAAFVFGCATDYQSKSFTGGFSETQLSENVYRVTFNGNGYTGAERAADFSLLRSAELAMAGGFRYFIIVESGSDSSLSTYTTPTQSYTTANVSAYGNSAYGSANTTTYGGQTFLIRKPSATNTIVCFKDKPEIAGLVYDAAFVARSIRQKYNITD
jgi:hypothetical protein